MIVIILHVYVVYVLKATLETCESNIVKLDQIIYSPQFMTSKIQQKSKQRSTNSAVDRARPERRADPAWCNFRPTSWWACEMDPYQGHPGSIIICWSLNWQVWYHMLIWKRIKVPCWDEKRRIHRAQPLWLTNDASQAQHVTDILPIYDNYW